jgi:3-oxoadipate enol-lactonase
VSTLDLAPRQYVQVNGIRLCYDHYGSPDSPPIVLVHGLGGGRSSWAEIAPTLAATHSVYALDMRGHADSDWPGTYSHGLMRDDVLAFLDALDLDDVTLIGHSMGGTIALLVTSTPSSRITCLIVEDTPLPRADMPPMQLRDRPEGTLAFDWAAIEAIVAEVNDPDETWWSRLPDVGVPALFIAGGPDSTVSQDLLAETARTVRDGRLVTISAGHHVHTNEPAAFLAAVTDFLSS